MFYDPGLGLRFPYGAGGYAGPSWLEHYEADLDPEDPFDLHIPSYSRRRRPAPHPFNDGAPALSMHEEWHYCLYGCMSHPYGLALDATALNHQAGWSGSHSLLKNSKVPLPYRAPNLC